MSIQLPRAMRLAVNNRDQSSKIRNYAAIIEEYFKANNIVVRVAEVNSDPPGIQFCLQIAIGTPIETIIKHQKGLAEVLASPGKRLDIVAPIPGRSMVGITLPWVYPF